MCYVAGNKGQESLVGFRVNKAVGNHLYPHRMPQGLTDGTIVYRNQDQGMEHTLSGKTSRRVLPLEWRLEETPQGFRLTAKQESTCVSKAYECEHQLARTDQKASITDVLSKLGDTIYEVANVEIDFSQPWFIPRSRLAEWRREVLAEVEKEKQTLPLTPPQGRGVVTTDLCPHQQNIILPPLVGGMGRGPLGFSIKTL